MKPIIITFFGEACCGKNTAALAVIEKYKGKASVKEYSFAAKIKEIAVKYFGWDGVKDEKGRKLLQTIGAAGRAYDPNVWINHCHDLISLEYAKFVEPLLVYEKPHPFIALVTDGRYSSPEEGNEMKWTQSQGGIAIRLLRNARKKSAKKAGITKETAGHESENSLATEGYDATISNSGTKDDFMNTVRDVVSSHLKDAKYGL